MADYYPPPAFHFRVEFQGVEQAVENDKLFQSVSGLTVTMQSETIKEGGENRFEHVVPVRAKYSDLVLKRGLLKDSGVIAWCRDAFENHKFKPINLQVELLNEEHKPLITWNVIHVWPKKWSLAELNAEQSVALIETLELGYAQFRIKT